MSEALVPAGAGQTAITSTNATVAAKIAAMQQASKFTVELFTQIGGSSFRFLPQLRLYASNSKDVVMGKIGGSHYGIYRKKDQPLEDLSKETLVVPIAYRAKAMWLKAKPPISHFNSASEEYRKIVATQADKTQKETGAAHGPEFLVWIPKTASRDGLLATFFMGGESARNNSGAVQSFLPSSDGKFFPCVLFCSVIQKPEKNQVWIVPEARPSQQEVELPPEKTLDDALTFFLNPKDSEITSDEADDSATGGAVDPAKMNADR